MTNFFTLDFQGTKFAVPKASLFDLFEHHTELVAKASYEVQSSVPPGIFQVFARSLETGTKVSVTKENSGAISLLAKEFCLDDLLSECSALQIASVPELIAALSERISQLEDRMSSQPLTLIAELKESIANHERQRESLDSRISVLEPNLRTEVKEFKSRSLAPIATPTPVPPVSPSTSLKEVEFPFKGERRVSSTPVEGIICYLARKHGGNVHDKGIVTITAKSVLNHVAEYAVRNVADLTSYSYFNSENDPGQWVC